MPARRDLKSICVLGSGPIVIGQAAEFDYSGVQAVKSLKSEGYRVVLVNSNPATIMTDPGIADATYIEPLTPEVLVKILEKERPDAVLPTVGGQTALNLAISLAKDGVLDRLGIELIGAHVDVIDRAENRERFKETMDEIGLSSARSMVCHTLSECEAAIADLGLPAVVRPSFTLGGSGGGVAHTREAFLEIAQSGLEQSPTSEVLIEESLLGWKEYELELMRDRNDNVVVVCSIENLDPMGVHTGDSITVAPAQTLSDREYQRMRDAGIAILRAVGVETGGSNVQFAINPRDGRMVVIEMNPRVSRSSALASKATGFPIAKVAAKLAVGCTLDEIQNDITQKTKAAFEPSIDYVVVKWPRFNFEKFRGARRELGTQMRAVGEVMSIGRTFEESFGKAIRSLELGICGLEDEGVEKAGGAPIEENGGYSSLLLRAQAGCPERIWLVAAALRRGATAELVHEATAIDPWFISKIQRIVELETRIESVAQGNLEQIGPELMWEAKQSGVSDLRIANLVGVAQEQVRAHRLSLGVRPVMKRVDTCAGEFEAFTPYLYSTYERPYFRLHDTMGESASTAGESVWNSESRPSDHPRKVVILGGGPIRIGQGIEFDYCCVHAAFALRDVGIESIMVNCNPETVSTDYDTSDRLYFEPLTLEDVLNILDEEAPEGVVVQFGGQTPLKLSQGLQKAGVRILGTDPDAIDRAEDRGRSTELVEKLGLLQPKGGTARSAEEAQALAHRLGFPCMIRPSYVLGGRAMELVHDADGLRQYLEHAVRASEDKPVLVDRFLDGAVEVDVDVLCDGERAIVGGVMQHIEAAGIHSGDSACVLPPHTLDGPVVEEICDAARRLALELQVCGLMNVQFAVQRNRVYVIEVNPRASRTVPFASKATGLPLAPLATKLMTGTKIDELNLEEPRFDRAHVHHYAVKEAVLPFIKFQGVDTILGPEMRSTGEVMGIDADFELAFAKSQIAAGTRLPSSGTVFVSIADADKEAVLPAVRRMVAAGFQLMATGGTHRFLAGAGVESERVQKVREGSPHIVEAIAEGRVNLVFNTTLGAASVRDSFSIRRESLVRGVPVFTTISAAEAASLAISRLRQDELDVQSLQNYLQRT